MLREVNVLGLLMPALVPLFFVSMGLLWGAERLFRRWRVYAWVAHPPFFRICVFVMIFCSCGLLLYR